MRILFLSTWYPEPADNGSKLRVFYLLQALAAQHEVTLCSFAWDTAQPNRGVLNQMCVQIQVLSQNPFARSEWQRRRRFFSPIPIVEATVPAMSQTVRKLLANKVYDVVVASTTGMAQYALLAKGISKVLEEHNAPSRVSRERFEKSTSIVSKVNNWVSWQKRRRYDQRLLRQFDLCIMVSEEDKAITQALLPISMQEKVVVISNGVDCERHIPNELLKSKNRLVYSGALTYSANYDAMEYFLHQIYPLIRERVPDVSLTITGSTEDVDLASLQLDQSVNLSGYVDDIRPVVANATVVVVPLRQGGGSRLKILEAMALGTVVVATSKGAEGLNVVDGKHLLIADQPKMFADCTVTLLQEPEQRYLLTNEARRLVEARYDWREISNQFVKFLEAAVSNRKRQI